MSDMPSPEVLKIDNVSRHYGDGDNRLDILSIRWKLLIVAVRFLSGLRL